MRRIMVFSMIILSIFLVLFLSSCMPSNPKFIKVTTEPSFITPYTTTRMREENTATIVYEIENPTKIDFNGMVTFTFDEDCLSMTYDEQDVSIMANEIQSYQSRINTADSELPSKCFKSQTILLRLVNNDESIFYDSEETGLIITR